MKKLRFALKLMVLLQLGSITLTAQTPALNPAIIVVDRQPDLIASVDTTPNTKGLLVVTVKNIGNADAPTCNANLSTLWTKNQWQGQGTRIPPIPAGSSVVIVFKYPFKHCERAYKLKVDSSNTVAESNERNNGSRCGVQ